MRQEEYRKMFALEDGHWWFSAKRMFALVFLGQVKKKFPRILDVGCGTGRNLLMLQQFGQAFGVDINPLALKFCRQRGQTQVKLSSAETLSFKNNYFDLVTIFDVLYHRGIKSDLIALKEIYRVIKPGGYLLVTDCAHQWLFGPHDVAMKARQRYGKTELADKIKIAGFKIKRTSYIFMFAFPLFVINRLVKKYLHLGGRSDVGNLPQSLNQLLILINRIESKLLQVVDLPIGSSIIILAKKS